MINYRRLGHYPIFAPVATGAVTTIEHESVLISDLKGSLERIAPQNTRGMRTIQSGGDGNGHSPVRAALLGPGSLCAVSRWQNVNTERGSRSSSSIPDNRPRDRKLIVQIVGG
ncbi:MAG: YjbQ family protein [Methanosarcinales archaeon]|nr:MAG: YjbQ family protein [Methanosarcinales archaeon]